MRIRGERFDALLALALAALFIVEGATEQGFAGKRPVGILVGCAFALSLAVRRRYPVVPLAFGVFAIEFANLVGPNALGNTAALLFAIVIAIYSAGAYALGRPMLIACGVLVAAAIPLAAIEPGQTVTGSDIGFFVMFFGGPFAVGRLMHWRRARDTEIVHESEERTRTAITEERTRIARELHDVIAHAVSVVVLQSRGARKLIEPEQAEVRQALDTIEHSASEALTEMRRLLSLLREQDEEIALAPQPSLTRLQALADGARAAGLDVQLEVAGSLEDLPAAVDVSGYRIVQEALTNAIKHAGPARASVRIERGDRELNIEVVDDGAGKQAAESGGHGLVGMRERVAVYGGRLEAGPQSNGRGYAVRVQLPLEGVA
jgi:signal transduction histidine kinase